MADGSDSKQPGARTPKSSKDSAFNRRNILLGGTSIAAATAVSVVDRTRVAQAQQPAAAPSGRKPNILVIWGDDVGLANVSAYSFGLMGYKTPNIDRIAREGMMFTDYYAEQSCTAGRSSFITGQCVDGDRNGAASRRLRGGLRLCKCGVVGCGQQQAGADLNAKVFHGFALLVY